MENIAFNDMFEQDPPRRNGRAKPVKRKWREIEALKDKQRLKKNWKTSIFLAISLNWTSINSPST